MNEILIEAQARYLIDDRIRTTGRAPSARRRRRHRPFPAMRWL
jgi:hypothetical protein